MKLISILFFLFINFLASGQKKVQSDKLFFFKTKDSLVGVRNAAGKIILKPRKVYGDYNNNYKLNRVYGDIIYLWGGPEDINEPHSWGLAYNKKGEFLFAPFAFDNEPDGFDEGLSRFVKNGKVGFANRRGDIVIEPKYDYADMFNYGIAAYCNGCKWVYKGEHAFVRGGHWGYINYTGDTLLVMGKKLNEKDQQIDSAHFIQSPFSYSKPEQKIIDYFYRLTDVSKAYFANYASPLDSNERMLRYEIVERPSSFFPYYFIEAFEYNSGEYRGHPFGGLNFCVNKKGDRFFYFDAGKLVPLEHWLKLYIKKAKEYLKKHSDAPYKF